MGRTKIVLGLCLLLCGVACGDDEEVAPAADSGTPDGGGSGGVGGSGGTGGGGTGGTGGAGTGGTGGTGGTAGTAGMEPDEDGGVEESDAGAEPPTELPNDGEALSVCASDDDCNGDDLTCAQYGTFQGYCAQDCTEDADCDAIDGVEAMCDLNDRCVIDCGGDEGEGDGECPDDMVCAAITSNPLDPSYRCQYPEAKDGDLYDVCDINRDNADCKEDLTCQMYPSLTDPRDSFCGVGCEEASDCDDLGSSATPVCDPAPLDLLSGSCALECEEDDDCPGEMTCLRIDAIMNRCGHEI